MSDSNKHASLLRYTKIQAPGINPKVSNCDCIQMQKRKNAKRKNAKTQKSSKKRLNCQVKMTKRGKSGWILEMEKLEQILNFVIILIFQ